MLILISVTVAAVGTIVGMRLFGFHWPFTARETAPQPDRVAALTARLRPLYTASFHKWWFDDLNDLIFVRFGGRLAAGAWWFDRNVIDGTVNGTGRLIQSTGREVRQIQTGHVQNYALGIALGLLIVAGGFLLLAGR